MIALPFVFFSVWAIRSYKKYGLSVGTYILMIYMISSLCAILIDVFNYYVPHSCPRTDLGFFSPILYVFLMSIGVYPFYKMGNLRFDETISRRAEKAIHLLIFFYLAIFFIVLLVSFTRLEEIFLTESMAEVRNSQYTGDKVSFYDHLHGPFRYLCAAASIISSSASSMLLIFTYLLAFSKKSKWYCVLALISSLTPLLISINTADRSQYFFWLILAGAAIMMFHKYYSKQSKRTLVIVLSVVLILIVTYLTIVTISRFGMRDEGGAFGSIIQYAGMPYINFCRFFNTLDVPMSFQFFFPFYNTYIVTGDRYFQIAEVVEKINNQPLAVFPTYLGIIYSVCGIIPFVCFLLVYLPISYSFVNKHVHVRLKVSSLYKLWCIMVIPTVGIITYFYIVDDVSLIVWLLTSWFFARIVNA